MIEEGTELVLVLIKGTQKILCLSARRRTTGTTRMVTQKVQFGGVSLY